MKRYKAKGIKPDHIADHGISPGINRAEAMWRVDYYIEPVKFPAGLGYEAAGIVDAVDKDVSGFAVGDDVNVIPSF
jgi:NADPH:quinone reductase-like Zn-dependent oxidoreductase